MSTEDRRAPGATRIPFDGLVEVGGALGPSFEAQAVNVSEDGMHLRTAYLPEQGQPLTCRFDAGAGRACWRRARSSGRRAPSKGGEFGVRFTDMDAESVEALKRLCGVAARRSRVAGPSGLEGAPAHRRPGVADAREDPRRRPSAVTVGSDLGFLQVGKQLELEDAQSGEQAAREHRPRRGRGRPDVARAAARRDAALRRRRRRRAPAPRLRPVERWAPPPAASQRPASDDLARRRGSVRQDEGRRSRATSRASAPRVERLASARRRWSRSSPSVRGKDETIAASRRTTAPPPGGGLHTSGRRVVRGDERRQRRATRRRRAPKTMTTKRKAAIAGGRHDRGHPRRDRAQEDPPRRRRPTRPRAAEAARPRPTRRAAAASAGAAARAAARRRLAAPAAAARAAGRSPADDDRRAPRRRRAQEAPRRSRRSATARCTTATSCASRWTAPIEAIEGAQQPTGFTVKIPGRKVARGRGARWRRATRASRPSRSRTSGAGAELTVTFKDGVPNYQVMRQGDTLVIALAPVGSLDETMAKKDEKGGKSKHAKHEKHKGEEQF